MKTPKLIFRVLSSFLIMGFFLPDPAHALRPVQIGSTPAKASLKAGLEENDPGKFAVGWEAFVDATVDEFEQESRPPKLDALFASMRADDVPGLIERKKYTDAWMKVAWSYSDSLGEIKSAGLKSMLGMSPSYRRKLVFFEKHLKAWTRRIHKLVAGRKTLEAGINLVSEDPSAHLLYRTAYLEQDVYTDSADLFVQLVLAPFRKPEIPAASRLTMKREEMLRLAGDFITWEQDKAVKNGKVGPKEKTKLGRYAFGAVDAFLNRWDGEVFPGRPMKTLSDDQAVEMLREITRVVIFAPGAAGLEEQFFSRDNPTWAKFLREFFLEARPSPKAANAFVNFVLWPFRDKPRTPPEGLMEHGAIYKPALLPMNEERAAMIHRMAGDLILKSMGHLRGSEKESEEIRLHAQAAVDAFLSRLDGEVIPGRPMRELSDNEAVEMMLEIVRVATGVMDPYAGNQHPFSKEEVNKQALIYLPRMQDIVDKPPGILDQPVRSSLSKPSPGEPRNLLERVAAETGAAREWESLKRAISLGIIGNSIDLADQTQRARLEAGGFNWVARQIDEAVSLKYKIDHRDDFAARVMSIQQRWKNQLSKWRKSKGAVPVPARPNILFLVDNSGEIVFNLPTIRWFIERGWVVTLGGKSLPHVNDMTAEDLEELFQHPEVLQYFGIRKEEDDDAFRRQLRIIATGTAMTGVDLRRATPELVEAWGADVIYAMGQGMFETLWGQRLSRTVNHALKVKAKEYFASIDDEGVPVSVAVGDALFLEVESYWEPDGEPAFSVGLEEWPGDTTPAQLAETAQMLLEQTKRSTFRVAMSQYAEILKQNGISISHDQMLALILGSQNLSDMNAIPQAKFQAAYKRDPKAQLRLQALGVLADVLETQWREYREMDAAVIRDAMILKILLSFPLPQDPKTKRALLLSHADLNLLIWNTLDAMGVPGKFLWGPRVSGYFGEAEAGMEEAAALKEILFHPEVRPALADQTRSAGLLMPGQTWAVLQTQDETSEVLLWVRLHYPVRPEIVDGVSSQGWLEIGPDENLQVSFRKRRGEPVRLAQDVIVHWGDQRILLPEFLRDLGIRVDEADIPGGAFFTQPSGAIFTLSEGKYEVQDSHLEHRLLINSKMIPSGAIAIANHFQMTGGIGVLPALTFSVETESPYPSPGLFLSFPQVAGVAQEMSGGRDERRSGRVPHLMLHPEGEVRLFIPRPDADWKGLLAETKMIEGENPAAWFETRLGYAASWNGEIPAETFREDVRKWLEFLEQYFIVAPVEGLLKPPAAGTEEVQEFASVEAFLKEYETSLKWNGLLGQLRTLQERQFSLKVLAVPDAPAVPGQVDAYVLPRDGREALVWRTAVQERLNRGTDGLKNTLFLAENYPADGKLRQPLAVLIQQRHAPRFAVPAPAVPVIVLEVVGEVERLIPSWVYSVAVNEALRGKEIGPVIAVMSFRDEKGKLVHAIFA